jgi:hypothetical protein
MCIIPWPIVVEGSMLVLSAAGSSLALQFKLD